jgi:argininosuccinate synthase
MFARSIKNVAQKVLHPRRAGMRMSPAAFGTLSATPRPSTAAMTSMRPGMARAMSSSVGESTEYIKVASHEAKKGEFNKCLLLYSGGLDTSVMLKWIQEAYECEVVALCVDIGQTSDDLEAIKAKALKLGATDCVVYDARDRFADDLLSKAIMANSDYQGGYALGCPLGRVMISQVAVEVAEQYGCQVIAHGCTGKGNDQVRFETYIMALNGDLKVIAPVREWGMGREEELEYARKHDIPVKQTAAKTYSYDENMFSNTAEGGEIEDPSLTPKMEDILLWCNTPEKAPDTPEMVSVTFAEGVPVALNGTSHKLSEIIAALNKTGGEHGVGVFPLIEDRLVGLKVRGVYENPGASILIAAHEKLQMLVSTREENEMTLHMQNKWAYLTYAAKYFDPVMSHINAYFASLNRKVSGTVQVKLYKGNITVTSLTSPHSLFDASLATFEKDASFNQNASAGFIEIYSLPQKTAHSVFPHYNR